MPAEMGVVATFFWSYLWGPFTVLCTGVVGFTVKQFFTLKKELNEMKTELAVVKTQVMSETKLREIMKECLEPLSKKTEGLAEDVKELSKHVTNLRIKAGE